MSDRQLVTDGGSGLRVGIRATGEWESDVDETEGVMVNWFVREGRTVEAGDTLCEIQVEKVSIDLQAPTAGTLEEITVAEDDEFEIGDTLGWIRSE
ncbi:lipoyl domain-containing protein [Halorubrum tebenquichense]|uniref:Biotin/lipoyl attachment domain-containing protein n=1 Tax=Halorubrum tebenquichense DSM 14210 TaxID=1227485 RepID=M0DEM5_9EURY|nr:lipoyl domain-containing protein [Halorubrum tebenquichense]ELZ33258.1 biotin/lipoyl attachment domain-containing protein [Halorubrum tebenquichense DSM 14210]